MHTDLESYRKVYQEGWQCWAHFPVWGSQRESSVFRAFRRFLTLVFTVMFLYLFTLSVTVSVVKSLEADCFCLFVETITNYLLDLFIHPVASNVVISKCLNFGNGAQSAM